MVDRFGGFCLTRVGEVPVLWRRDPRFKTLRVSFCLRRPLDERAAARSLLPSLLLEGTARDPDRPALARRMERLYGASAAPAALRLGESHLLRFTLDSVAGEFLPEHPDQLGSGLALLADFAVRPRLEAGRFPEQTFERKRRQAADSVRARFDDKGTYAREQALGRACAGEPLAIPEHGGLEAIQALSADDPERARQDFLARGQRWILAMGALPDDGFTGRLGELLVQLPAGEPEPVPSAVRIPRREPTTSTERVELQQSKMVMVFRFDGEADASGWAARALMVNMLGGGPHARLFNEVREKQSLAYYAGAGLDRHKGLVLVQVGLDEAAADAVQEVTLAQLRALAAGEAQPQELEIAKATFEGSLSAVDDAPASAMGYVTEQWLLGEDFTPEQKIRLFRDATLDGIVRAAGEVWFDHRYLLAPSDNGGGS